MYKRFTIHPVVGDSYIVNIGFWSLLRPARNQAKWNQVTRSRTVRISMERTRAVRAQALQNIDLKMQPREESTPRSCGTPRLASTSSSRAPAWAA